MLVITQTEGFKKWLTGLKDHQAKAKVTSTIRKFSLGNFGDVKPVGNGISETKIHYGPGYRVYHIKTKTTVLLVLAGGTKKSQSKDIELSKTILEQIKNEAKKS